jgi:PAS domain S-box-containing protein
VTRLAVPAYADWCFVELLRPDGHVERVAMEHADRELVSEAPFGSADVIRTGEPRLISDVADGVWREAGFVSSLIVPLRVRGTVIGDLALAIADSGRRYGESDVARAQELADRCALAIDNARLHTSLRETRDDLRAILEGIADAVTAQAPDGRLVYANDAAVRLLGFASSEEMLAAVPGTIRDRFEMRDDDGEPIPLEILPGRRALAGERPPPLTVRYRNRASARERWSRVQSTPVFDADGGVRLAINVIEDITELKRAEHGHRFLAEASRVLTGSLDYQETLGTVARLVVPQIADWCAVDLADGDGLDRVAVAHVDPARVELARAVHKRYPPDPRVSTGVYGALRHGTAELYGEITDEMLVQSARDEEHLEILRSVGVQSVMLVPMQLRDRVLGVISFVSSESGRRFDEQDLALAEDLALRAAAAVENARLYETAASIASTLQSSLLPPVLPEIPAVELAAAYRPARSGLEVGGDFYDVFSTGEDQWYAVVGDVCGKGAEAAAVTALARYTIRAAAVHRRSPSAILRWLSDAMLQQAGEDGRFCTIACAHLDVSRSPARVTIACGGHPLALLVRADGTTEHVGEPGTLLGFVPNPELQDRTAELRGGDTLVLYTDGLAEAGAPEHIWTPDDLAAAARATAGARAAATVDHLLATTVDSVPLARDDVAVLALRALTPRPPDR